MEFFKYRNLALGCGGFIFTLLISYYLSLILKIMIAIASLTTLIVLLLLSRKKRVWEAKNELLRYVPLCGFAVLAIIISINTFDRDHRFLSFCDSETHSLEAVVESVEAQESFSSKYLVTIDTIDGLPNKTTALLQTMDNELDVGYRIRLEGVCSPLSQGTIGFDESAFYLSNGAVFRVDCSSYKIISTNERWLNNELVRINKLLDKRFERIKDKNTYYLTSALFLGNKDNLPQYIQRDFSRLGLSHILALSGMHISIVVAIFTFILEILGTARITRVIVLSLSTMLFVGITGFSASALRAGVMVVIHLLLSLIGETIDNVTCLFLSVTIICAISPYYVFSTSLMLSFLSMLGCFVSFRFVRKTRLLRPVPKPFRLITLSIVASIFAMVFTLPIVTFFFGSLSLITPISNLALSPVFTALIYLCPAYLAFADVPLVGQAIEWACTFITDTLVFVGGRIASVRGIAIPITGWVQILGVLSLALLAYFLMFVARKKIKRALRLALVAVMIFAIGSLNLLGERLCNTYVGCYHARDNDIVFVENNNSISFLDMTKTAVSSKDLAISTIDYLGYNEIDTYVITDYSSKTYLFAKELLGATYVRNLVVPIPDGYRDEDTYEKIDKLCRERGVSLRYFENELEISGLSVSFAEKRTVSPSTVECSVFTIENNNLQFTYIGSGAYELPTTQVEEMAYGADIVVFGSRGPTNHILYKYEMPYLDYCVFLGKGINMRDWDMLEEIIDRAITFRGYPIRFKLN